jgi:hypothetical protein
MSRMRLNAIICDLKARMALEARYWPKVDRRGDDECWDWIAKAHHPYGYGRMTAGRGVNLKAHQIAYALTNGPLGKEVVRHSCDRPQCCNPSHLIAGTQADNMADAKAKGRTKNPPVHLGEKHPKAKFSEWDALTICQDRRSAWIVARQYGISSKTVYRLRRGETWKDLAR